MLNLSAEEILAVSKQASSAAPVKQKTVQYGPPRCGFCQALSRKLMRKQAYRCERGHTFVFKRT